MSRKSKAIPAQEPAPAKRGRGRPLGSKTPPRDPNAPKKTKTAPTPIERASMSRKEFCARHGIGSSNTYAAMIARGDGPKEMILGKGPHAVRRISFASDARWVAEHEAREITEEERAADRESRAAAHAANMAGG